MAQRSPPEARLVVLADDLTGCLDTSLAFFRTGRSSARAALNVDNIPPGGSDVLGLDSDSRHASPSAAAAAVTRCWQAALDTGGANVYKKVDSALRGPLAAEIAAVIEITGRPLAICPALPSAGRVTRDGVQRADGQPVPGGDLTVRLASLQPEIIPLSVVRTDPESLADRLSKPSTKLFVIDSETDDDLGIVAAALLARPDITPSGAAGLADAIALRLYGPADTLLELRWPRPPLIVTASLHPRTFEQLSRLQALFSIDPPRLFDTGESLNLELRRFVESSLRSNNAPAIALLPGDPARVDRQYAARLGTLAAQLVSEFQLPGLVVSGGDTTRALCQTMDIQSLELAGAALPHTVISRPGSRPDLTLVTKSGGFGSVDALRLLRRTH